MHNDEYSILIPSRSAWDKFCQIFKGGCSEERPALILIDEDQFCNAYKVIFEEDADEEV